MGNKGHRSDHGKSTWEVPFLKPYFANLQPRQSPAFPQQGEAGGVPVGGLGMSN